MKNLLSLIVAFLLFTFCGSICLADDYVRGYTRRDGTYIAPYMRSDRGSSHNNNWSVRGNTNPHTGKSGQKTRLRTTKHANGQNIADPFPPDDLFL
jgi:hypothetical protein